MISEKRRIIELGSGTGLIGIACGMLLSAHTGVDGPRVAVTDMESVMPFLRENIESNGVVGAVEAAPLLWGTDVSDFGAPVDAVLMADVAYTDAYAELAATLASLCGPETLVLHYLLHDAKKRCGAVVL